MQVTFKKLRLTKLMPLGISRGTSTGSLNLYVYVEKYGHIGIGECAPGTGFDESLAEVAENQLRALIKEDISNLSIHAVYDMAMEREIDAGAVAALDTALWDLAAKRANMPLYKMLGLPKPTVATSVTIGINPPDVVREKVPWLLDHTGGKSLKIKLGSPEGIDHDKESYLAARESAAPFHVTLRVDANGGWSQTDALTMMDWLSERGCDYVEQPLVKGAEDGLPELYAKRKLPLFIDESCRVSQDVARYASCVDGVNMKLMKCGGITEALRIIACARAHGLKSMIGCMADSSVAIAAGAAVSGVLDHIDLDSHMNQNPDPADGLEFINGVVTPRDVPGHGAYLKSDQENGEN